MASKAADITLTLATSDSTVIIVSDKSDIMHCFMLDMRRCNNYDSFLNNTYVFSKKSAFDQGVAEARDLGLLPF